MTTLVNAGARLDRLPISSFHKRIFLLIGAGMFFDGYDLYVGTNVLGTVVQSKFATLEQVPQFISLTFLGLTIGSLIIGFVGDRYGRRFTYQFNLMIFGLASLAAAFAPDMMTLNILRFVMGLGLGAEIVCRLRRKMLYFVTLFCDLSWPWQLAAFQVMGRPGGRRSRESQASTNARSRP
jgi:putative MFS transporter